MGRLKINWGVWGKWTVCFKGWFKPIFLCRRATENENVCACRQYENAFMLRYPEK
jgi:hypothetical protein